jgi:hypothetical protein
VVTVDLRHVWCRAVRTPAPVDDLSLVELEAVDVGSGQAMFLTDGTVDICNHATRPADHMMVVVAHPSLVEPN